MRIRLLNKSKSNNYTESCMINEADGWRGRNVWYLGRSVRYALKEITIEEALPYLKEHQQELTDRIYRGKYPPSPVR